MRSRSGKSSDAGSGSESDARSSSRKQGGGSGSKGGDGGKKVRRHSGSKSLVAKSWTLVKQVFFTIVHIYKSLTAFWSQMHVCMLPALGELDHEQEQQEQDKAQDDASAAAAASPGSPGQRKRTAKVNWSPSYLFVRGVLG